MGTFRVGFRVLSNVKRLAAGSRLELENRRRWTFHTQKNNRLTLTADTVSASARQRRDGNTVSAGTGCAGCHHYGNVSPVLYSDRRAMRHSICKTNARLRLLHTFVVASTVLVQLNGAAAVHARMLAVTVNDSLTHAGTQL